MDANDVAKILAPKEGMHKILFVTNFLESSGTVINVQNIIISGWEYRMAYDSMHGCFVLRHVRISTRSFVQQRGRGGRDRKTNVYILFGEDHRTTEMSSIMANSDEDLSDNILSEAKRSSGHTIPHFAMQEESASEQILMKEALQSCKMTFPEGHRNITVLSRKQVALALVELKFLRLSTDGAQSKITYHGTRTAGFGLRTRYSASLTHPDMKHERYCAENNYDPLFFFMILSIGIVVSSGRYPLLSEKALERQAERRMAKGQEKGLSSAGYVQHGDDDDDEDYFDVGEDYADARGVHDHQPDDRGKGGKDGKQGKSGGKGDGKSGKGKSDSRWTDREITNTRANERDVLENREDSAMFHTDDC